MLTGQQDQIIEVGCNVKPKWSHPFANVIHSQLCSRLFHKRLGQNFVFVNRESKKKLLMVILLTLERPQDTLHFVVTSQTLISTRFFTLSKAF
jgi:hypothetical protein